MSAKIKFCRLWVFLILNVATFSMVILYYYQIVIDSELPYLPPSNSIKILLWTPFFHAYNFSSFPYLEESLPTCQYTCEYTFDKSQLNESKAIVIHPLDTNHQNFHFPLLQNTNQVRIMYMMESPGQTFGTLDRFVDAYNWTMTYRLDSDIHFPYGKIRRTNVGIEAFQIPVKPRLAVWIVSHCKTQSFREKLISKLSKWIPIDVYGDCGRRKCHYKRKQAHKGNCILELANQYKFFMAFENSLCVDYVTEKFFLSLQYGMVPIVYGRANYFAIAPPNSYIDVRNFSSVKSLAHHLRYLNSHHDKYAEYLHWRNNYEIIGGGGWCELCRRLQNDVPLLNKVYRNITEWWSEVSISKLVEVDGVSNSNILEFLNQRPHITQANATTGKSCFGSNSQMG